MNKELEIKKATIRLKLDGIEYGLSTWSEESKVREREHYNKILKEKKQLTEQLNNL